MTRDDIIRMARGAELYEDGKYFVCEHSELVHFAALVAAAEREACANLCDRVGYDHEVEQGAVLAFDLAVAIRARGDR